MFTKTFFRISIACLLLALLAAPAFGANAAPPGGGFSTVQTSYASSAQWGFSQPPLPGIECSPGGTGGSGSGCGGG